MEGKSTNVHVFPLCIFWCIQGNLCWIIDSFLLNYSFPHPGMLVSFIGLLQNLPSQIKVKIYILQNQYQLLVNVIMIWGWKVEKAHKPNAIFWFLWPPKCIIWFLWMWAPFEILIAISNVYRAGRLCWFFCHPSSWGRWLWGSWVWLQKCCWVVFKFLQFSCIYWNNQVRGGI